MQTDQALKKGPVPKEQACLVTAAAWPHELTVVAAAQKLGLFDNVAKTSVLYSWIRLKIWGEWSHLAKTLKLLNASEREQDFSSCLCGEEGLIMDLAAL